MLIPNLIAFTFVVRKKQVYTTILEHGKNSDVNGLLLQMWHKGYEMGKLRRHDL